MLIGLTLWLVVLAAMLLWVGFVSDRAPNRRHPAREWSQAGFVITLGLLGFCAYFAWRQARTVAELTELIDPVPNITEVVYVPTQGEVEAFARQVAAVPASHRGAAPYPEDLQTGVKAARIPRPRYWLLTTAQSVEAAAASCRDAAARRGWTIETDSPQWLELSKGAQRLTISITDDWPRAGTAVLYALSPSRIRRD